MREIAVLLDDYGSPNDSFLKYHSYLCRSNFWFCCQWCCCKRKQSLCKERSLPSLPTRSTDIYRVYQLDPPPSTESTAPIESTDLCRVYQLDPPTAIESTNQIYLHLPSLPTSTESTNCSTSSNVLRPFDRAVQTAWRTRHFELLEDKI